VTGLRKEIEALHGEKDALYVEVQGLRKGMWAGGWEEASALRVQVKRFPLGFGWLLGCFLMVCFIH